VDLEDFIDWAYADPPDTIEASTLAALNPNPWIWRTGSGRTAQIRMRLGSGKLRYVRRANESVWHRAEWTPNFDVGSHGQAI
jgi:hypothetical protein